MNHCIILITLLAILFTLGVVLGLFVTMTQTSMPVLIGIIIHAGMVVNNAIVLVEHIEIERENGLILLSHTHIYPITITSYPHDNINHSCWYAAISSGEIVKIQKCFSHWLFYNLEFNLFNYG